MCSSDLATIKYKVEEYLSRYSSKNNKDIVIKNGEDKSDINGEFKFSFIAPATKDGLQIKYPSTYLITVYATDIKGESKEVTQFIRIGNNRYNINGNIPNIVEANSNFEPIIELSNYQNKAISGIKNEYKIEQNNNIILKGEYYSGVPIKIDWSSFKQGKYSFIALNSDGDNYKKDFIIFSKKATSPPIDTLTFFASTSKVCNANTPISFVFGTNTDKIYASLTLSYGDSIILNRNMVFKKGMKEYNLPYLDKYPAAISLQLDFIYDCKLYSYKRDYSRENIDKPIKMKFISLRDKVEPDSIEKFSILVTDTLGNPIEAEIMLTAYNKASDTPRPNIFNKLNIEPPYLPSINIRSSSFNESYVWKRHISNKSNIIAGVNRVVDNDVVDDDIILEESIPFATGNNMEKSDRKSVV